MRSDAEVLMVTHRRWFPLAVVLMLVVTELIVLVQPAQAAGSVSVRAWSCPASVQGTGTDPAAYAAACTDEADGLTFGLTANNITRRRATAPGTPASWPAVTGQFTLAIDEPKGEPAVAFCQSGGAAPEQFPAPEGSITSEIAGDAAVTCTWYRLAVSTPDPTPTPQPTSTPQPTATSQPAPPTSTPQPTTPPTATQAPTNAASPTSTQFPTATAQPTVAATATPEATATPTQVPLPEPIDTGPPEMFRGDPAHTGRQADSGPDGDPVLLWRYPVAGRPYSSPVYAADVIYIGTERGVMALGATTGTMRWELRTESPVTATPAVVGGVVYVGAEDGVFYAIDAGTGVERWRFETGGKIRSSAVYEDGALYFSSFDGSLYSLDAATGEPRWVTSNIGDEMTSSPAIDNGVVFLGSGDLDGGQLAAFSAETGEGLWRYRTPDAIGSSPTVLGAVVYFGGDDGFLHAADVESGERVCRYTMGKIIRSSPAALDGVIVIADRFRTVKAVNAGTCDELWTFEGAGDWIDSSPAVAGNTLYFGSKDDSFYAIDATTGELRWSFPTGGSITTTPVVAKGVVYFTSRDGFIYAIAGSENEGDAVPPPDENAASTVDIPKELAIDRGRYRFDRVIPIDRETLEQMGQLNQTITYSRDESDDATPIYTTRPGEDEDDSLLIRYLPERLGESQVACFADGATDVGQFRSSDDTTYVFAGVELDLTADDLTAIADNPNLGQIFAEGDTGPFGELFVNVSDEFQRFVLLNGDGLPSALQGVFPFAGQDFTFAEDVTDDIDAGDLTTVGCAGPFALKATADGTTAPFGRLYADIAGRILAFDPAQPSSDVEAMVGVDVAVLPGLTKGGRL